MSLTPLVHSPNLAEDEFRRMKTDFLSSLNHEIRTPLSGILGMADLLMETSLDEEQLEYVSAARMCAEELLNSLNSAIEFSAVSSGAVILDEADFNLPELLAAVCGEYRAKVGEKGVAFAAHLDENLPEVAWGDGVLLRQMLAHLLGNALRFTSEGSITMEARALPGQDGKFVLDVTIRDTGTAADPGLVLALVSKLACLMGGHATIDRGSSRGSVALLRVALGGSSSSLRP
jgi:signal transduction histidine kinase